jgi:hypothetical protein
MTGELRHGIERQERLVVWRGRNIEPKQRQDAAAGNTGVEQGAVALGVGATAPLSSLSQGGVQSVNEGEMRGH